MGETKNMKYKFSKVIICLALMSLYSCYDSGTYQYVIHKKDGTKIKCWLAEPCEGMVSVYPPSGCGRSYYLFPGECERIEYVGTRNIHTDK